MSLGWSGRFCRNYVFPSRHFFRSNDKNREWFELYNFVNDAGHTENGIYALRALYEFDGLTFESLKGFRSIESKLTGHGEAHLNPQGVLISNGPLGSGIAQAQGLAMGDRLASLDRVTVCTLSDGGAMEGEAREALASIPGLASKGKCNPFVLIISDNNTKLSGRILDDSFDMSPTFQTLKRLGWNTFFVEDGHNLELVHQSIEEAIDQAKSNDKGPVALVVKTIKGKGVKSTEKSASGGHGYPLKAYDSKLKEFISEIYDGNVPEFFLNWAEEIESSRPKSGEIKLSEGVKKEKVQPGFARAVIEMAEKGLPIVSISADLQGSTGIQAFRAKFPQQSIDVGIAESNMISVGIGLSKAGFIPIVDTFSQFGITKGNLPLIMAGLSQGPVIGLFSHIGFQDAADGASHQATTYLSAIASIPHLETVICSCSREAQEYMYTVLQRFVRLKEKGEVPPSTVFFMGRENFPAYYKQDLSYEYGKPQVLEKGKDALVVANGPMVPKALKAAQRIKETRLLYYCSK